MTQRPDSAPSVIDGGPDIRPSALPSNRSFALVMTAVFAVVALWPLLGDGTPRRWAMVVAAVFGGLGLLAPDRLRPLNRAWMRLGGLLHRIVAPVVFGLLFYGLVTPLAVAMRLAGRRPLALRFAPERDSYWIDCPPAAPADESMRRQF